MDRTSSSKNDTPDAGTGNASKTIRDQILGLRGRVLKAEKERLAGAETMSVAQARKALREIDATAMTDEELHAKLLKGYESAVGGRTQNAAETFKKAKQNHRASW